jgi:hypothetical protein
MDWVGVSVGKTPGTLSNQAEFRPPDLLQIYLKMQEFWGNNLYIFWLLLRPPFATDLSAVEILTVI